MAKKSSITFGVILIIAGLWSFIQSPILGIFTAGVVSGIIHIIAGIALLVLAGKKSASAALKTVGIVYLVFAIAGLAQGSTVLGIFAVNGAATWLYFILGVVIAAFGWSSGKKPSVPAPSHL